ncbi:MAG: hypothetical protein Q9160_007943 [Pyrenula sp. 1 TL-2023]
MSHVAPPTNPSLLAIILIVQSRAGPRFVFHYPPDPLSVPVSISQTNDEVPPSADDSSSDSGETSDSASDGEKASTVRARHQKKSFNDEVVSLGSAVKKPPATDEEEGDSTSSESDPGHGTWTAPWESFLSMSTSALEKLLSPNTRTWHKRRFEVGVNELCFVGWPVFIRDDGTWQKRKIRSKSRREEMAGSGASFGRHEQSAVSSEEAKEKHAAPKASEPQVRSPGPSSAHMDTMTMFNVVFVLNPPVLEYSLRVREMYDNVVKKLGRALKWEQARVDYVWKEAQVIMNLKDKARESRTSISTLYSNILHRSSLARAIAQTFTSISANKIASATFTSEVSISLQIPPISSTPILPLATDPPTQPGLWLTTADSVSDDFSANPGSSVQLAKHFALLLLDNESSILKDVDAAGGQLASALGHYIRCSSSTKSFAQISAMHSISLADIQLLARHLVYWRRARAIPPLHQRDTYIVSPNADMSKLDTASRLYSATFPTLPGLPKMLAALSGTPRQYASLIPSKDHKEMYFLILAWLLRGGWVTQLRTFAWIKVTPSTKQRARSLTDPKTPELAGLKTRKDAEEQQSDGQEDERRVQYRSESSDIRNQSNGQVADDDGSFQASLIMSPHRASPTESRWMEQIQRDLVKLSGSPLELSNDEVQELQDYWVAFSKFFNGNDALEKIPVREGLKRKKVWSMLGKIGIFERGVGDNGNRKTLLGVRHW